MQELLKQPGVVQCNFKKGDYLIRQGEEIKYLYYLQTGSCYRTTLSEKGVELIFSVKKSSPNFIQSLVGVLVLYTDGVSMSNFIAKSDCKCYRIPTQIFLQYVNNNPETLKELLTMAMKELRELAKSFLARQEGKVANRLCAQLLNNARLTGGKLVVSKEYSKNAVLARFLGIHKVTVAKITRVLKEQGVITKEGQNIIILDEKRLTAYANAEEIIEY